MWCVTTRSATNHRLRWNGAAPAPRARAPTPGALRRAAQGGGPPAAALLDEREGRHLARVALADLGGGGGAVHLHAANLEVVVRGVVERALHLRRAVAARGLQAVGELLGEDVRADLVRVARAAGGGQVVDDLGDVPLLAGEGAGGTAGGGAARGECRGEDGDGEEAEVHADESVAAATIPPP